MRYGITKIQTSRTTAAEFFRLARSAALVVVALTAFCANSDASSYSFSSSDAVSSAIQSAIQSARDDAWRAARRSHTWQSSRHPMFLTCGPGDRSRHCRAAYRSYAMGNPAIVNCMRRFKSYDVRSRTYVGYDYVRRSCPRS
jgi:hypothetical protein